LSVADFVSGKALSAISGGLMDGIPKELIDIPLGFLKDISSAPLKRYIKKYRKFVDNSLAVLESKRYVPDKENIPFFALAGITKITYVPYDNSKTYIKTVYKGDDVIYEIG